MSAQQFETMAGQRSAQTLLAAARHRLTAAGIDSPDADARILLAAAADIEPARLPIADQISASAADRYQAMLGRREAREPVQYITGIAYFRHVCLHVGPGVFVPRPETELMTGWALERLRAADPSRVPVAVDLGTGSGAIAAAIADEVPAASVHAAELSEQAADWAAANLTETGVDLRIGDMTEVFDDLDATVDVVACNPPYVPLTAWESVQPEARDHDPLAALFAGPDGLAAIRSLTGVAARLLRPGGWVCCEHAEVQSEAVLELFAQHGSFDQATDHVDYTGRPRFVTARRAVDA
jgi:release factor glutamine methyltransferase